MLSGIEKIVHSVPEVESTSRRTGLQLGLATVTEANNGDFSVKLKKDRKRDSEEIIAEMRAEIAKNYPAVKVEFIQLLADMIGDLSNAPEPVHIKLFSQNPQVLQASAEKVGEAIKKIPGIVDVLNGIDNKISGPAIVFQVDPTVAARSGFATDEVELNASAILQGEPAPPPVVMNDRAYTIRVRFPENTRASVIRSATLCSSARPAGPLRWERWRPLLNCLRKRKSAAKTSSARLPSRRASKASAWAKASVRYKKQ